jgi:hypothetical protein
MPESLFNRVVKGQKLSPSAYAKGLAPQIINKSFAEVMSTLPVSKQLITRQERLFRRSKKGIGRLIARMKAEGSEERLEKVRRHKVFQSAAESAKQVVIEQLKIEARGQSRWGYLGATSAKEPDFEHALLEGIPLPLERCLEHVSRFGCRHDIFLLTGEKYHG